MRHMRKFLWMVLFVVGYFASIISAALPIAALEYTSDWAQVFDTFGPESLALDAIFCIFKLAFFLYGLGKGTLEEVFDTVSSVYIETILAGAAIFIYHTIKKHMPQGSGNRINATAFFILGFSLVVLTGFAALSHEKFQMSRWLVDFFFSLQAAVLVMQTLWPVIYRLTYDKFENDERVVYMFKMIASGLTIVSSIVDCISFEKESFNIPKWTLVTLPIVVASVNAIQMVIRTIGPRNVKDFISGVFTRVDDFFITVYQHAVGLIERIYKSPTNDDAQSSVLPT